MHFVYGYPALEGKKVY